MKHIKIAGLVGLAGVVASIAAVAHASVAYPCNSPTNDPSMPTERPWGAPGCTSSYAEVGCYYDGTPPVNFAGGIAYAAGRGRNCSGFPAVQAYAFGALATRASADGYPFYESYVEGVDGSNNPLCTRADTSADGIWSVATNCTSTPVKIRAYAIEFTT